MAELRISSFLQDDEEREDEEEEKEDSDDEIGDEVEGNDQDKSLNPAERRSFCTFMKKRAGRLKDEEKNSKQQKLNLLHEGYAKLITALNQEIDDTVTPLCIVKVVQSTIECFNLDPNRVLDVTIKSFERRPQLHSSLFVPLIRSYKSDSLTLCEVLGLEFASIDPSSKRQNLFVITALLLQHGDIRLEDIYRWLTPKDSEIDEFAAKELADAKEYARRMDIIDAPKEDDKIGDLIEERAPYNQKFQLCEALLSVGAWDQASILLEYHPDFFVTSYQPISSSICNLINYVIEPVYGTQAKEMKELRETAFPMLLSLGPHLCNDPVLLHKLIRLCNTALDDCGLNSSKEIPQDPDSLYFDVCKLFDVVIWPSLALMESNCSVAEEIWNVLKKLPHEHRYRLYDLRKNDTFQSHCLLIRRKVDCVKRIKEIMKRVSKDNVKPTDRELDKLSHSCPGFLFDYILSQIQIDGNMIGPLVYSLEYLTNLSYDVLGYCVLEALSNPDKERINPDGTTISMWLTALSAFCEAIWGIEESEEMSKDHMEAMQGGKHLRAETAHFGPVRVTKKVAQRLKETLLESNLVIPLCKSIAQQRCKSGQCLENRETENNHLKLDGKLYDQCQVTLVQLGTLVALDMSDDDHVRRRPQLESWLSDYHNHADVAFFLARPMFANWINSKYDELRKEKNLLPIHSTEKYIEAVRFVMTPIYKSVRPLYPDEVWDHISLQFVATFWSLTVYDLSVPNASYEREVQRLEVAIQNDLPDSEQKDQIKKELDRLRKKKRKQKDHQERMMARLTQEKDNWFLKLLKTETILHFLRHCLFPRCVFTATDALFCAHFVQLMHSLRTPNFSTLNCYDRIFGDITKTVTSYTENEANCYGRFLCAMLETVMRWHSSKQIFDEECANYPGFVIRFQVGKQPSNNWHHEISKALVECLKSKDNVKIRNALIVLIRILPFFPVITRHVQYIDRCVEAVHSEQRDKRQDLSAMAISYSGLLKNKNTSIPEDEFHRVTRKPVTKTTPQSTNSLVVAANPGVQPENGVVKHEGVNGVEKALTNLHHTPTSTPSESQSSTPVAVGHKEIKKEKEIRETKDKVKEERIKGEKDRHKESIEKREEIPDRTREKRIKERKEDGEDRPHSGKLDREDERMERDGQDRKERSNFQEGRREWKDERKRVDERKRNRVPDEVLMDAKRRKEVVREEVRSPKAWVRKSL